jgi:hypothetical protein
MPGYNPGGYSSGNLGNYDDSGASTDGRAGSSSGSRAQSIDLALQEAISAKREAQVKAQAQAQAARVFAKREADVQAALDKVNRSREPEAINEAAYKEMMNTPPKEVGVAPGVRFTTEDLKGLFNSDFANEKFNAPTPDFTGSLAGIQDAEREGPSLGGFFSDLFSLPDLSAKSLKEGFTDPKNYAAAGVNALLPGVGSLGKSIYNELTNDRLVGSKPTGNEFKGYNPDYTVNGISRGAPASFDYDSVFGDDGGTPEGNYRAIQRFLAAPTYENIPEQNINYGRGLSALEQALLGIDDTVSNRGFEGLGYAESGRDRARNLFDTFGEGDNIDDLLNFGVGQQFGTDALTDTENQFRSGYTDTANQRFAPDFQLNLIDPDAFNTTVDNILGDRRDSASRIIGNAGARGNLSSYGQQQANTSLGNQEIGARDRVSGIARGVESEGQRGLTGIGDEARGGASGFTLGDSAFDITPFSDRATTYRTDTSGSFDSDVNAALGSDPLFDTGTALSSAAGSQGVVSGTPSFLDTIATRQGRGSSSREQRGLGSRGSGKF